MKNEVLQRSILAPIMFLVYEYDIIEGVNSCISLFADDAKLQRKIRNSMDCEELQNDLNNIHEWSKTREMEFN